MEDRDTHTETGRRMNLEVLGVEGWSDGIATHRDRRYTNLEVLGVQDTGVVLEHTDTDRHTKTTTTTTTRRTNLEVLDVQRYRSGIGTYRHRQTHKDHQQAHEP